MYPIIPGFHSTVNEWMIPLSLGKMVLICSCILSGGGRTQQVTVVLVWDESLGMGRMEINEHGIWRLMLGPSDRTWWVWISMNTSLWSGILWEWVTPCLPLLICSIDFKLDNWNVSQLAPCLSFRENHVYCWGNDWFLDSVHSVGTCFPFLPLLLTGFAALASLSNASLMPMPRTTAFRFLLWLTLEFSYRKCDQIRDTWLLGVSPQGLVSSRILVEECSHTV